MSLSSSQPSPSMLRLLADYKSMLDEPPEGVSASPVDEDNMFIWNATIFGPDETEWEGGILPLILKFPEEYPSKPPKVRFTVPIFHPNVYNDGSICLDIIQDKWRPIYTVNTILLSIQSLLTDPNPASPANPMAAKIFSDNVREYKKRVRKFVQTSMGL
mmetsp:Transcript_19406/g.21581  ORF Transcript_19406/g.21581 Transcript_19406/m.21581 type:complete len:159 (+) Transcript_19406:32-508(+)